MKKKEAMDNHTQAEALLAQLLEDEGVTLPQVLAVRQREDAGLLPLSFAQERLWFLDQMEPGSALYNIPHILRLSGVLDVAALERSLIEINRRHEVLRTGFHTTDGQPIQVLAETQPLSVPVIDLSHVPQAERQAEAQRHTREESARPFDLEAGPLFRATLLRLAPQEHWLLLNMHHIVSDGWSLGVLTRELSALYEAYQSGRASPLEELSVQYADYAAWQREWLQGERLKQQLIYWREQLDLAPAVLELPTDHPRPAVQSFRGATHSFTLSAEVSDGLKALSQRAGVTLFMTLLAAFQLLLSRYSRQSDIVVGTPIAGRTRSETESLIGFFINTLVLRTDCSGDPTFTELLGRVREVCLGAYAHQDVPFEKLVEELEPERDLSHNPLFQVMFILQNAPHQVARLSGLRVEVVETQSETSKFDLSLRLEESERGLKGEFSFNTDLFEAETIRRLSSHLGRLLAGVVAEPERRVSGLELLSEQERERMLFEWNDTNREYPKDKCIHELFEEQAQRTPDAVALVFEEEELSYRELNERANQLGHHLRSLGVGPEVLVGILVERSVEMVVGLLGILKAGGAYVPLDPAYPQERLAFMLRDAAPAVLLTQQRLVDTLPLHQAQVVCLDSEWKTIAQNSQVSPSANSTAENLAYVIYTSGSTGNPKGVAIKHQSALVMLRWAHEHFPAADLSGVLAATSICFDLSVFELFVPLSWGGRVVLVENVLQLATLPTSEKVTLVNTVPSAMTELVRMGAVRQSVRTVNLAGEALAQRLVEQVYEQQGVERVLNLYGPSEDTTYSTFALIAKGSKRIPSIGRTIANTHSYVLDSENHPVPIGVAGELYLGGDGLARGYLNRPELTAEKFVPNPFGSEAGARLYRTGDLVRYLPDGNLEFLGRLDHQVKIRGFRIELGEIEAALVKYPAVRDCIVLAREDVPGEKRLIAYLVAENAGADSESIIAINELRSYLKERLPEYMIPSLFVQLEELPLTPNGKVNRRALPAPDGSRPDLQDLYVEPQTPVQEILAAIWREVLNVERVGINDNFFALGGHSLKATQVMSRVRQACAVELPLRSMFASPTVKELSEEVESRRAEGPVAGEAEVELKAVEKGGELPLSFAQQRLWFLDQLEPGSAFYHIPRAMRMRGKLDTDALERSLSEIVRRHEVLRTSFRTIDRQPVQVIAPPQPISLSVVDFSSLPDAERQSESQRLMRQEARLPFNLATGPVLRARVLRLGTEDHLLLLTIHHIASDGWSIEIFARELQTLYGVYCRNEESPLEELPIQYADYAVWQREWLQGERLDEQLSYWKQQLGGAPAVLELPTDHPRPAVQSFKGALHSFTLSSEVSDGLKALSQRSGATLFMTLLAAFQLLLSRYSRQSDIVVGTPIAGRTRSETESLIGFFINTLVLRTDCSGDPTFTELLGRVREVCLGAYAHQDVPFEKLVEELEPERDLSYNPLFQVMFALQNAPRQQDRLSGLQVEVVETKSETSKFDLSLRLEESERGLKGEFSFNTDLFEAETLRRVSGYLERLLAGVVAGPEHRISELELLSEQERHQLLFEWNDTSREFSRDKCLHQLFEEQAERTPEAVALVFEEEELSYRELNERANQLAHHLRSLGVGPEVLVGILVERSVEMVVGLLGILKAGGAYVPLDPAYPLERIAVILKSGQVSVLLTQQSLVATLPQNIARVVCLDSDWVTIARQSVENPYNKTKAGNAAYVIYTSGSTGQPKGVMIEHRSVLNLLTALHHSIYRAYAPRLRVAVNAPLVFDSSVKQLVQLCAGHTLYVVPENVRFDAAMFTSFVERHELEVLDCTPSQLRLLIENGLGSNHSLKFALVGGEAIDTLLWSQLASSEATAYYNVYGPTECTVDATACRVGLDVTMPTIGKPLANVETYVLDEWMGPVPVGVAGELYIGGDGLARGYLNRADLTAERFVPHPFGTDEGARLYRTGDLVKYLPDGNLEFIGRIDQQVKVRGFRIELGEIEAVLSNYPAVRDCIILAREDVPGDRRLVAYTVAEVGQEVTSGELRAYLKERLPEYMIPAIFVQIEELPLTPNGKVDRRALPAPDGTRPELEDLYVEPRTPVEEILAQVWTEVLHVTQVGVHDNFFELGGHSLLATQVVSRVRELLQIELPLRSIFTDPTVAGLADVLVKCETVPGQVFAMARLRIRIASMSSDEIQAMLQDGRRLEVSGV